MYLYGIVFLHNYCHRWDIQAATAERPRGCHVRAAVHQRPHPTPTQGWCRGLWASSRREQPYRAHLSRPAGGATWCWACPPSRRPAWVSGCEAANHAPAWRATGVYQTTQTCQGAREHSCDVSASVNIWLWPIILCLKSWYHRSWSTGLVKSLQSINQSIICLCLKWYKGKKNVEHCLSLNLWTYTSYQ